MVDEAFHGLAGEIVRTIEPQSEADPVALLVQFLVAFGNCIGRGAHWRAGGDEHHGNLFAVLVGTTAKGRKGTAWGEIRRLFSEIASWTKNILKSGLSSSEGLIWAVRDPVFKINAATDEPEMTDGGVTDKRLLLIESEFSQVLKQAERTGNTLSPIIRQAWERGDLESLTKNSPAKATGAHISITWRTRRDRERAEGQRDLFSNPSKAGSGMFWIGVGVLGLCLLSTDTAPPPAPSAPDMLAELFGNFEATDA